MGRSQTTLTKRGAGSSEMSTVSVYKVKNVNVRGWVVKKSQKLVNIVCERTLIWPALIIFKMWPQTCKASRRYNFKGLWNSWKLLEFRCPLLLWQNSDRRSLQIRWNLVVLKWKVWIVTNPRFSQYIY